MGSRLQREIFQVLTKVILNVDGNVDGKLDLLSFSREILPPLLCCLIAPILQRSDGLISLGFTASGDFDPLRN